MKRLIIIMSLMLSAVSVSAHNHNDECDHEHNSAELVAENPQQYVTVPCPNCGGACYVIYGYNYWGYPLTVPCFYCQGRGWVVQMVTPPPQLQPAPNNPSFRGSSSYHAECNVTGCKCKLFVPQRTGSTKCTCEHRMSAHTKRYL